jgi:NAD(P)-dependent dehydrogenase (short-subunit alcohol dehydrogenase family)
MNPSAAASERNRIQAASRTNLSVRRPNEPERGETNRFTPSSWSVAGVGLARYAMNIDQPGGGDRVVLVTGGTQGLGAAVCRQMAARGWSVAVGDVNEAGAHAVAEACGKTALAILVDLATADGPGRMVDDAVRRAGRLDVLVNCAAVAPAERFLEMSAESWEQALRVNVRAVALAMAAAGRVMAEHGGGRIINVTSAAARMALPNYAAYAATKAAVDSLTRSAAVALAPHGIRVNSLSPGMMDTPLQERTERIFCELAGRTDLEAFKAERTARIPLGRRSDPEEMAAMVVWLATEAPDYMTAARLNVTGGLDKD